MKLKLGGQWWTNLSETDEKQLMVGHSQRGQRRLLAVPFDPVHVSLSEQQTITLHTHTTQHLLKWKLRTGRKCRSGPDIFLRINAKAHRLSRAQVPRLRPFSVMETMFTCAEVTAGRRRHLSPFPGFAVKQPRRERSFQHKWWGATHSCLSKHTNARGLMLDAHAGVWLRTPSRCRKHNARVRNFPP